MVWTLLLGYPVATAIQASPSHTPTGVRYCVDCLAVYRQEFKRCPLDGGALVVGAHDPWIGTTVGTHYVIDGLVGEGAMGRVYRAHRSDLADERHGDVSRKVDVVVAREVSHAQHLDLELVEGSDPVSGLERLNGRRVRRCQRPIIRKWAATALGTG